MKQFFALSTLTFVMLCSFTSTGQFVEEKRIEASETYINQQVMRIMVTDANSNKSVPADVTIKGLNPRKPITMEAVIDTTFEIRNYRLYTVSCALPGYMYYADKFWPAEKELHIQQVKMEPLAVGQITDVRDISFLGDKTEIYHKSKPALMEIVEFMKMNPTVKIAVIGHVNGPDNAKSQKFYTKASLARAKAVVDFLVSQGISEDRLTSEGVGNTQMLYPDPQTEWQNDANRRIQIKVTEV